MPEAYIAVGSNIEPFESVKKGLLELKKALKISAISSFYLNSAVGTSEGQHEFLNGIVVVETELPPHELKFNVLRVIEKNFGRQEGEHKHDERRLDLDLILYGSQVIETEFIQLPHPEILTRDFVYVPLLELTPSLIHPQKGLPLRDLIKFEAREMNPYNLS